MSTRRRVIGVRGPGHTVAKIVDAITGAPSVRLVNQTHPEFGGLMASWVAREGVDVQFLRRTEEGEPVAEAINCAIAALQPRQFSRAA